MNGKETVVYTCNRIIPLTKEGNYVICDNMTEPWGCYAKWNKPLTERQITTWLHLYEVSKVIGLTEQIVEWQLAGTTGRRKWEVTNERAKSFIKEMIKL